MANFEQNRRVLYNEIPKDYKKLNGVVLTLDQFNKIWYKDEKIFSEGEVNLFKYLNENVDNMFVKKSSVRPALKSKRTFYRTFACDLEWAKKYTFCSESNDIKIDESILKSLIGNYVSDVKTDGEFKIFEDFSYDDPNQPFKLGISSYYLSYVSGTLDNPRMEGQNIVFDISIDTSREDISNKVKSLFPNLDLTGFKPTISFNKDGKSFNYDILNHKGVATKVEDSSSNTGSTEKTDSTSKTD